MTTEGRLKAKSFEGNLTWRCHVCGELRPDDKISVAVHTRVDGNGIESKQNVRYCNDNGTCEKIARLRDHTSLWAFRSQAAAQTAKVQAQHWKDRYTILFWTSIAVLVIFVGGVALADWLDLI